MRINTILLFILTTTTTAFTIPVHIDRIVTVKEFKTFTDSIGLLFEMPAGYKETMVKANRDLSYAFAIKDQQADFEVRYTVWRLKPQIEIYKKCRLDTNCTMIHPNATYKARIQANVLNMTGGENAGIGSFPQEAVKQEFNADDGGSSFFEFKCGFGTGYKYGQMIYLHKDNVADVVITYMSNNKTTHSNLMNKSFHALVFK